MVIAGVFLGFQLNNWNEARAERANERQYVLSLLDDMRRSAAALEENNRFLARQTDTEFILLESLKSCSIAESDQQAVGGALASLGKFFFAQIDRELLDELRASGALGRIGSADIRESLAALVQSANGQRRTEAQFLAQSTPMVIEARSFYFFEGPAEAVGSGRWDIWDNLRFDLETACADPSFIAAVGNIREATRNLMVWNGEIAGDVDAAIAALESEVEARGWSRP